MSYAPLTYTMSLWQKKKNACYNRAMSFFGEKIIHRAIISILCY